MIACENSGHSILDDFAEVSKIVEAGATSKPKKDYELSRYACYLIVLKTEIRVNKSLPWGKHILRSKPIVRSLLIITTNWMKTADDWLSGVILNSGISYFHSLRCRTRSSESNWKNWRDYAGRLTYSREKHTANRKGTDGTAEKESKSRKNNVGWIREL